jgi:histidine triad (HIT) family protein
MEDSVFTKIVKGEIPAHKIYEDEATLAFLSIEPIQPGHTLVIPKNQVDQLWDLDTTAYQAVMDTAQKVARHLREVMQTKRVGVLVLGVDVPHAHVHLIPFNTTEEFYAEPKLADNADLAALAEKLAF